MKKLRIKLPRLLLNIIAVLIAFLFLFPYLFMVTSAFKTRLDTFAYPPVWIFTPSLENLKAIFEDIQISFYFKNSFIVSISSSILTMLIAIPATYSFARFRFPFKDAMAYGFLFLQMIPGISIVFALFYIARALNMYDTYFYFTFR